MIDFGFLGAERCSFIDEQTQARVRNTSAFSGILLGGGIGYAATKDMKGTLIGAAIGAVWGWGSVKAMQLPPCPETEEP